MVGEKNAQEKKRDLARHAFTSQFSLSLSVDGGGAVLWFFFLLHRSLEVNERTTTKKNTKKRKKRRKIKRKNRERGENHDGSRRHIDWHWMTTLFLNLDIALAIQLIFISNPCFYMMKHAVSKALAYARTCCCCCSYVG